MEQTSSVVMAMLKSVATAAELPKTGKANGSDDFQKLLEKAQSGQPDSQVTDQPKTEKPAQKQEQAPAQKQEDPLERIKKLMEQGCVVVQPAVANYNLETGEVLQPGQYVQAWNGSTIEVIPTAGLDEAQMQELQQLMDSADFIQFIDVSDPEADAMLEATAPGADNSPAAMLEKLTAEQFGQEVQQAVEEVQPQQEEDGLDAQLTDLEQAPQRIFHDVKAAPVKVGEVYDQQPAEKVNVAQQIDTGLAQAMERGESLVRIQLNPENLGSVTVEIAQSADGVLRVALSAHSSETRNLLERHAGDLQGLLSSRTQQTVEVEVQRQQESQQGQNQHPYDGRSGHGQGGQEQHRPRQERAGSQDFMQQLRLGLIPSDADL